MGRIWKQKRKFAPSSFFRFNVLMLYLMCGLHSQISCWPWSSKYMGDNGAQEAWKICKLFLEQWYKDPLMIIPEEELVLNLRCKLCEIQGVCSWVYIKQCSMKNQSCKLRILQWHICLGVLKGFKLGDHLDVRSF